jgi:hypothetical protein
MLIINKMAHVVLNLQCDDDMKPNRVVTKEEVFEYFDNIFDFFSQSRSHIDYLIFNHYISNFRRRIDTQDNCDCSKEDSNVISSAPDSSNVISSTLDNETVREKRLKALETRISTKSPDLSELTHKPEETKQTKEDKYKGLMKLPVWASERTRELRAQLLGLSVDEV